jgi:hypothetical protein
MAWTRRIIVLCCAGLSACAVFEPIPAFPPPLTSKTNLATADPLDHAFAELYLARDNLEMRVEEITHLQGTLTIATFAGAMSTVGFGLFRGSADSLKISLFATGGTVVANRLFASSDYRQTYMDGITALVCVEETTVPALSAIEPVRTPTTDLEIAMQSLMSALERGRTLLEQSPGSARNKSALTNAIAEADSTYTSAFNIDTAAKGLLLTSIPLGNSMHNAVTQVMDTVRRRINGQIVDPSDVVRMVQSIGQLGVGQLSQAQSDLVAAQKSFRAPEPGRVVEGADAVAPIVDELHQLSERVKTAVKTVPATLSISAQAVQSAVGTCKVQETPTISLIKDPTGDVELKIGGQSYSYSVVGGKGPFREQILGPAPANVDVPASSSDGVFTLQAKGNAIDGQQFTIQVLDVGSVPAARLTFKVTIKK